LSFPTGFFGASLLFALTRSLFSPTLGLRLGLPLALGLFCSPPCCLLLSRALSRGGCLSCLAAVFSFPLFLVGPGSVHDWRAGHICDRPDHVEHPRSFACHVSSRRPSARQGRNSRHCVAGTGCRIQGTPAKAAKRACQSALQWILPGSRGNARAKGRSGSGRGKRAATKGASDASCGSGHESRGQGAEGGFDFWATCIPVGDILRAIQKLI
jgi:hypothetical protein